MSSEPAPDEGVTCSLCGARADATPLTWSYELTDGRARHLCERCTREHVRAVEAKLDQAWW